MNKARSFLDGRVVLHAGDCRDVLKELAENSVDSVVTDPPYHLTSIVKRFGASSAAAAKHGTDGAFVRASGGFMGKQWDGGDIAFRTELWAEVLRVLKPGGYIMAFSGCRTYHRMACAIEDAGFVTHPMFAWIFGSGFPKAHSVSKQIDKSAGVRREVVCRSLRHLPKTKFDGLNGGAFQENPGMGEFITAPATPAASEWDGWFYGTQSLKPALESIYFGQKPFSEKTGAANVLRWGTGAVNIDACRIGMNGGNKSISGGPSNGIYGHGLNKGFIYERVPGLGRWPANLITDGSEEVLACFPESDANGYRANDSQQTGAIFGSCGKVQVGERGYDDSGSAARFFASFPQEDVQRIRYGSKADSDDRAGSRHPTVKPLALIQYLVRLITPPNGGCLDLFAGTGTTAEAAYREGFRTILIEREAEYIADIERRMSLVMDGPETRSVAGMKARGRPVDNGPLFADEAAE